MAKLSALPGLSQLSLPSPPFYSVAFAPGGNDVLRRCCCGAKGSDARGAQKESGREKDGTTGVAGETAGKLEIFIAAPFPFYAESRGRGQRSIHCALMRFATETSLQVDILNDAGRMEKNSRV